MTLERFLVIDITRPPELKRWLNVKTLGRRRRRATTSSPGSDLLKCCQRPKLHFLPRSRAELLKQLQDWTADRFARKTVLGAVAQIPVTLSQGGYVEDTVEYK